MFGVMIDHRKHAIMIYLVMLLIFLCALGFSLWSENLYNPSLQSPNALEGKELRFGKSASILWATATTAASNGSVNAMHDSLSPAAGGIALLQMLLGEIIFGGVGSGLYGMLLFVLLTVFLSGLMVGRTPEYLGKKIEAFDIQMAVLAIVLPSAVVLLGAAISVALPLALKSLANFGPHGLSEILYAWASAANNNGSAFAGLNVNTDFYNLSLSAAMLLGRFGVILPVLAIAGNLANKNFTPTSSATLATDEGVFAVLLTFTVLIIGALTFFPALALGPLAEQLLMLAGRTFRELAMVKKSVNVIDRGIITTGIKDSLKKLDPRIMIKNPVMFVTWVGALLCTWSAFYNTIIGNPSGFEIQIAAWLWFTVLFANFAEALAEGRGKAQAEGLKKGKATLTAKKLVDGKQQVVPATALRVGDFVVCETADVIPADGEVTQGFASVDDSAITGESAPVIRESGGDRSAVTGGTRVISDRLVIRVTADPGNTFLDRIISLIENAKRQKTPNELALTIVLTAFSIIILLAVATLKFFADYSASAANQDLSEIVTVPILIALLVCLIPTTIGGLLSAIGISGMDRLIRKNVIAKSGKAIEAAGDIDILLIDKTGTITLGNRMAVAFIPTHGCTVKQLAEAAQLASLADETPEGRSIVILAKEEFQMRAQNLHASEARFVPFSAETRMSGIDLLDKDGNSVSRIRKGAMDAINSLAHGNGAKIPADLKEASDKICAYGGTPLAVIKDKEVLGIIHLKDMVKGGIKEKFHELHLMGIKTIMITGDNPMTAAAIAAEAGVDDFIAEATPESKLLRIREEQAQGHLVAMTGDGTNDAPALAQADVGVAMNTGTQAAREAGNLVDLDSNPTKVIAIVETGKQLLMTRGALTTFSIANDIAKYFAILPAIFVNLYAISGAANGPLYGINIMYLHSPKSAILSAVIFNALIIVFLIPLALNGVAFKARSASTVLKRNLRNYGVVCVLVPIFGIKHIDILIVIFVLAS